MRDCDRTRAFTEIKNLLKTTLGSEFFQEETVLEESHKCIDSVGFGAGKEMAEVLMMKIDIRPSLHGGSFMLIGS